MKTLLTLALVIQLFLTGWWLKTASVVQRQQQERLAEEKTRYEVLLSRSDLFLGKRGISAMLHTL